MSDLISRQAIFDRTVNRNSVWNKITDSEGNNLEDIINSIPTAENKGDLISRQVVLDELEKWDWQELYLPIHFKQILDDIPSVENNGENRPKGHWIYPSYPNNYPYMWKSVCSNCNTGFPTINKDYKFCPECGAKMRGSE